MGQDKKKLQNIKKLQLLRIFGNEKWKDNYKNYTSTNF